MSSTISTRLDEASGSGESAGVATGTFTADRVEAR